MCGILGSVNLQFDHCVLDLITSRGPDDSGIDAQVVGKHDIMLGHRRLSIVDLSSAGHQPMKDQSGQYTLCYNGEVYNHTDLKSSMSDVVFRGHSDTETILNYLIRQGVRSVSALNGIFAFAFVDRVNRKLYLARDPFGIKPLYYRHLGNTLVFSSELKPILHMGRDTLSLDNLGELLTLRYSASPSTLYKDIRKVRPGHLVEVDLSLDSIQVSEYSYVDYSRNKLDISFPDAIEEYGRLFSEAVDRQLMSDVDLGVLLSGGIDSALVARYAAEQSSKRLKAFTVGFGNAGYEDETEDARESAKVIGMDYMDVNIGFDDFFDTVKKCISIVEEPSATTSIVPMYHLSRLAAENVKVVLSGQGADEPLGGYRRYQGEVLKKWLPAKLVKSFGPLVQRLGITSDALQRGIRSLSNSDDVSRFLGSSRVFEEHEISRLIGVKGDSAAEKIAYFYDLMDCLKQSDSVERMMSVDMRMNLSDDLLLYTDKITMHHSLECRVPMLDHKLVRFIESIPAHYRVRLRQGKIIHKAFANRVLPESIVNRKKKGFLSPTRKWFKRKDVLAELLLDKSSRFANYFDVQYVEKVIDQHLAGYNKERHIFLFLSTYFWLEEFG